MKSILITGCNRGIGLGLIKFLVKELETPRHIIATCRDIQKAKELSDLSKEHSNLEILELDVKKPDTFNDFSKKVENIVGAEGLNVLFNNAGYSPKSTRINFVNADQLIDTFQINTVGPILLTKSLLPLLKKTAEKNSNLPRGCSRAAVINMSSTLGSIEDNTDGGLYPYRCSKAALNMATRSLSVDLKDSGIVVTCVHPGWVKTDMGGPNAPMPVEKSVTSLVSFIRSVCDQHNGQFFQWDGKKLRW